MLKNITLVVLLWTFCYSSIVSKDINKKMVESYKIDSVNFNNIKTRTHTDTTKNVETMAPAIDRVKTTPVNDTTSPEPEPTTILNGMTSLEPEPTDDITTSNEEQRNAPTTEYGDPTTDNGKSTSSDNPTTPEPEPTTNGTTTNGFLCDL